MKKLTIVFLLLLTIIPFGCGQKEIRLIVRGDDIGSSHNANLACIESYKNGIVQSVEIMVPGPWFEEAVKMLNENPGLDVGIHLVLNSEWNNYKWRPLTCAPSITDQDGYFLPMVWPGKNYADNQSLAKISWDINEIEKELRAQIELAMRKIPRISHLSCHMGWTSVSPEIENLYNRLAKEYNLEVDMSSVVSSGKYYQENPEKPGLDNFIGMLKSLKPGTYLYVEHPGLNTPEAKAIFHTGYENVATERQVVTDIFTSPEVKKTIAEMNIRLIAYKDLKK